MHSYHCIKLLGNVYILYLYWISKFSSELPDQIMNESLTFGVRISDKENRKKNFFNDLKKVSMTRRTALGCKDLIVNMRIGITRLFDDSL